MEASEQVPEKVNSNPLFCTDPSERKTIVSAPLAAVDVMAEVMEPVPAKVVISVPDTPAPL